MRWVLAFSAVLALAAGCGSSRGSGAPATSSTTATTLAPATTTTTSWAPTAAQPTPDAAAAHLVSAWATNNRTAGIAIASPSAVDALFAQPYPAGYLQSRGCTSGANPATCTYRNTRTDGIYEIGVTSGPGGWYVSSVTPET
ncbi:MAG TPA: hypothetical protein VFZ97_18820 [Acidimicrobiales bacterium]